MTWNGPDTGSKPVIQFVLGGRHFAVGASHMGQRMELKCLNVMWCEIAIDEQKEKINMDTIQNFKNMCSPWSGDFRWFLQALIYTFTREIFVYFFIAIFLTSQWRILTCTCSAQVTTNFFIFKSIETAVNVGYACKLMDPDTKLFKGVELRSGVWVRPHTQTSIFKYKDIFNKYQKFHYREILQSFRPELCLNKDKESHVWSTHNMSQWSKAAVVVDGFELVSIWFCLYIPRMIIN